MRRLGRLGVAAALVALGATACAGGEGPAQVDKTLKPIENAAPPAPVERGRYLVTAMGCDDCHTPKKMGPNGPSPDPAMLLAGHPATEKMPPAPALPQGPWLVVGSGGLTAWSGPWGVSYAANLTPDPDTGMGNWTEAMFVNALRSGKHMGASRPILPPMPWQSYRNLSDDDLRAIFAYLRTIPAISNRVPDPVFAAQP
jgi:Cytochrome c